MIVEFSGKDVTSEALEQVCRKKLARLEKMFKGEEPKFEVNFSILNKEHIVTIKTKYNSFALSAKAKTDDMYKSIDEAIENLKSQIEKNKFDKKEKRGQKTTYAPEF